MARLVMFKGPKPPQGRYWCTICSMLFKASMIAAYSERINLANGMDEGPPMWIEAQMAEIQERLPAALPPEVAITRGVYAPMQQLGVVEICWSHAMGVQLTQGSVMPSSPQEMAALAASVPVLGQRGNKR
jgi:hypothetical protein